MFNEQDYKLLSNKGITVENALQQISYFKNGFPFIKLNKAATINNGIQPLDEKQAEANSLFYEQSLSNTTVLKFVPASGAASRMFQELFAYLNTPSQNPLPKSVAEFFERINEFAMHNELDAALIKQNTSVADCLAKNDYKTILNTLLYYPGLEYGNLPKALLKFHAYKNSTRTSAEEHLVEAALYAKNADNTCHIHFTISPEHRERFIKHIDTVINQYEKEFNVRFIITYSVQHPSTDTIAVDLNNNPFRNADGTILFRPGGHGALIKNLNELEADVIIIKNIDNVSPDRLKPSTVLYKKALAGILLKYRDRIFNYLINLETKNINESLMNEIDSFLEKELCIIPPPNYKNFSKVERLSYIMQKLNRPIRVCGMVKNQGEPGGGPFWTINNDGSISLQIVEPSQVDKNNETQLNIFKNATHFNPVDIICCIKDYKGKKFNLINYIDNNTGFISKKSKDGKDLKALELPGLWNGAMSNWNTIFVETPIITFNPVKTINDLLRKEHLT